MYLMSHYCAEGKGLIVGTCKTITGCMFSWESGIGGSFLRCWPRGVNRRVYCGALRFFASLTKGKKRRGLQPMPTWQLRQCEPSPGATKRKDWNRHCTKSRDQANGELWMRDRVSGSSPWYVVRHPRAKRGGRCGSSPPKRSSEN